MDTIQLEELMEWELGDTFVGVFARDQLPEYILPLPSALIVNLDPSHKEGSHWCCFYKDVNGIVEFFDSSGTSLEEYPDLHSFAVRNTDTSVCWAGIRLQGPASASCGQYCCYFLTQRFAGKTMEEILEDFTSDRVKNDCLVADWVNERYESDTNCHPWPHVQSCKPLLR